MGGVIGVALELLSTLVVAGAGFAAGFAYAKMREAKRLARAAEADLMATLEGLPVIYDEAKLN